jgi:hypothetical protein
VQWNILEGMFSDDRVVSIDGDVAEVIGVSQQPHESEFAPILSLWKVGYYRVFADGLWQSSLTQLFLMIQ